jgi:uncharacterized protein YbaR (Trm112 family)
MPVDPPKPESLLRQLASVLYLLACPACESDLCLDTEAVFCPSCGRRYPIVDGIPVLIPGRE